MLTMQEFYNQLNTPSCKAHNQQRLLQCLTQSDFSLVASVKKEVAWDWWGIETP